MDALSIVEHSPFSMSMFSPLVDSELYTVTSQWHPDGYWLDVVHRVELGIHPSGAVASKHSVVNSHADGERQDSVRTVLATIFYIDAETTRVRFSGNNSDMDVSGERGAGVLEGEEVVDLDAFLKRMIPFSDSRVFRGPDGVMYKWRVNGKRLELYDTTTYTLIARSNPRCSKFSFPRLPKRTQSGISSPLSSTVSPTAGHPVRPRLQHPTLTLHPALLSLRPESDVSPVIAVQLRDAVVLTYVIMQRLLKEKLKEGR